MNFRYARLWWIVPAILAAAPAGCAPHDAPGTPGRPIVFSVRPCVNRRAMAAFEVEALTLYVKHLAARTGLHYRITVPDSMEEQLRRLETGAADIFFMSPVTYVLAHDRHGAKARFAVTKRGHQPTYRVQLLTLDDSAVRSVTDLRGRPTLLLDGGNPIRYWLGYDVLARAGIAPSGGPETNTTEALPWIRKQTVHRLDASLIPLYLGQVAACAVTYVAPGPGGGTPDARSAHLPPVAGTERPTRSLGLSRKVPYPALVFRRGLPEAIREHVARGLHDRDTRSLRPGAPRDPQRPGISCGS